MCMCVYIYIYIDISSTEKHRAALLTVGGRSQTPQSHSNKYWVALLV